MRTYTNVGEIAQGGSWRSHGGGNQALLSYVIKPGTIMEGLVYYLLSAATFLYTPLVHLCYARTGWAHNDGGHSYRAAILLGWVHQRWGHSYSAPSHLWLLYTPGFSAKTLLGHHQVKQVVKKWRLLQVKCWSYLLSYLVDKNLSYTN